MQSAAHQPFLSVEMLMTLLATESPHLVVSCNLLGPLQQSFGPFGPVVPKKSKKVSVPGREKLEKVCKEGPERVKTFFSSFQRFNLLVDFFLLFFDPGAESAKNLFCFRLFGISGPKGPKDFCKEPRSEYLVVSRCIRLYRALLLEG